MTVSAETATPPPLSPDARALDDEPIGTPTVLGDGNSWTLADCVPKLGGVWDTLYDHRVGRGKYRIADIRTAATHLLRANYAATPAESFSLIADAEPAGLVAAVEVAMLPMPDLSEDRTFSRWAESALWAAGLDPAKVPAQVRSEVLEHLEATGRCIPRANWIGSHLASARRTALLQNATPSA